jgi:hypothetical protein|tara:strand:- start:10509 stop:11051 length:543 start_codon:yes stop_codon:yes gene_type:complete
MVRVLFSVLVILALGSSRPTSDSYVSNKYGFAIDFPSEVEIEVSNNYVRSFTAHELVDESFIMYQVQVLDEQPGYPLEYDTEKEYETFLKGFLASSQFNYDHTKNLHRRISLFKNKYYSLDYEFEGVMKPYDLPVSNKGIIILHHKRLKRVSFIYPQDMSNYPMVQKKYEQFIGSFRLID